MPSLYPALSIVFRLSVKVFLSTALFCVLGASANAQPVPRKPEIGKSSSAAVRAVPSKQVPSSKQTGTRKPDQTVPQRQVRAGGLKSFNKAAVRFGKGGKQQSAAHSLSSNNAEKNIQLSRLNVSGGVPGERSDRLEARPQVFSGGPQTLSTLEESEAPELHMSYALKKKTAARLSLNSRDTSSPLYSPVVTKEGINTAGVYLDMDVKKNVQLTMGGEYRADSDEEDQRNEAGPGAAIGLKYNF